MITLLTIYLTGAVTTSAVSFCLEDEAPLLHFVRGATWFVVIPWSVAGKVGQ